MSVLSYMRGENVFTVFTKAADLLAFTIRTATNRKNYPVRYREELSLPVISLAREIMQCVYEADLCDGEKKADCIDRAKKAINAYQAEIVLAVLHFRLPKSKAGEWALRIDDFVETFTAWVRHVKRHNS